MDPMMGDFDVKLIGDYHLSSTSAHEVQVSHITDSRFPEIPSKVVQIAWNDRFIIAKQQELKPRGKFPGDTYLVPVEGKFNFWIIDVNRTNSYGPIAEQDFATKLQFLNVRDLKLKRVSPRVKQG
jgi:hypothetical protein